MTTQKPFSIAVVGGGIAGVVFTNALLKRGIKVRLYERGSSFSEYGAGLGMTETAVESMKICVGDGEKFKAFQSVVNKPPNPDIVMEFLDGWNVPSKGSFAIPWEGSTGGAHRVELIEALAKFIPEEVTEFSKSLVDVEEPQDESDKFKLVFADGTTALADAVVGCDGVGSRVRRHLFGKDHPSARAKYAQRYVYRALLPIDDAISCLGKQRATTNTIWLGYGSEIVHTPISGGKILGVTAVKEDPNPWSDEHHLVVPAKKEDVLKDFEGWGPEVTALLSKVKPQLDRWGLFDLFENPLPFYARGRICLIGDAAHATTPHLGSGAGFSIEDAAVLSELLGDDLIQGRPGEIEAAFQAYNTTRLPRGHWLVKTSRQNGTLLEFLDPDAGDDMEKCEKIAVANFTEAWDSKTHTYLREAKDELHRLLSKK